MLIAPSEIELITMLFTVGGRGEGKGVVSLHGGSWLVGWYSCPNSSISTKPLQKSRVPSWSNDTTEQMIMGREGKKYQTYKVSITWTIGHILCFFFFFFFFLLSLFHFIFLALKGSPWSGQMIWPATAWPWTKSRPGWQYASLTGHSHHIVGLGGTGSAQHHQFLLAADVTVHHGAHRPAVSWGGAGGGCYRHSYGAGLRLIQNADGAVLANAVGHLKRVHPECELTGEQQVELLDGQADALARLPHQWVHLVVDANAAVTWTLAWSVWEPVVLIVLWRNTNKRKKMWRKFSCGVIIIRLHVITWTENKIRTCALIKVEIDGPK